nr:CBS domain-containing protein [Saprospiraceae bacterium]
MYLSSTTSPIRDVEEVFASEVYRALPFVDNGELKGIVTTTDVIACMLTHLKIIHFSVIAYT